MSSTRSNAAPTTRELVEKAQAGDREASDALFRRHQARLSLLVHLRLGAALRRKVEVDDVVHEVFLQALTSLAKFRWTGKGCFLRWLGGIAEHRILNLARYHAGAGRANEVVVPDPLEVGRRGGQNADSRDPSPSEAMRRRERFERLEKALSRLSEDHREVIILARIEGVPIKDIAARLGKTPDAVSMLLLRALRSLRGHFGSTESFHLPLTRLGRRPPETERDNGLQE